MIKVSRESKVNRYNIYQYNLNYLYAYFTIFLFILTFNTVHLFGDHFFSSDFNRLLLLQKRIVRILAKVLFDAHTNPIFKEFQLLKFEDIYIFQLGIFMYKYSRDLLPKKFDDMFPRINEIHD